MVSLRSVIELFFLLFLLTWSSVGCTPTVETVAKVQPNSPEAAALRRVAVIGFVGRNSDRINAAFETMLVNHRLDGEPYFIVVDRARTQELMREYGRSLRGEIEPSTAARFGKQTGAEGVYFGDIATAGVSNEAFTAEQSYCVQYNSSGRKCKQYSRRSVSCRKRTATVTIVPRLVNVETAQVAYRAERTGTANVSTCGSDDGQPDDALMEDAIAQAIAQIRADIAPTTKVTRVQLMEEPSKMNDTDGKEFSRGLAFAKENRMDRACEIWSDLNQRTHESDNALLYNLAVCEETEGNYEDALNFYEQVDKRLAHPDGRVSGALLRVKSTLAVK
jgi:curli biogenesis system outer membrane secretion channel CsgG